MGGKGGGLHLVEDGGSQDNGGREKAMDKHCPNKRSIVPETRRGNGVLNRLLEVRRHGSEKKFRKHFASVRSALSILGFKSGRGCEPHRVGPSLKIVDVDLLEVFEKIDLEFMPLGWVSCVVVVVTAAVGASCLILRNEGGTFPTTKLLTSMAKLERPVTNDSALSMIGVLIGLMSMACWVS